MKKWVEKSLAGNEITSCATPYDACISARRIFWDKKNRPENLEKPKRKECPFAETVLRCLGSKVKQKHCPLLQSVGSLSGNVIPMFEFRSSKSPTITKFKKIGREMFFLVRGKNGDTMQNDRGKRNIRFYELWFFVSKNLALKMAVNL